MAWGDSGSGPGQFDEVLGVAVDNMGHVFASDNVNERIHKFTTEGLFITSFGDSGSGNGELLFPRGLACDPSGNVYVAGMSTETWGTPLVAHGGDNDAFVAKLDSSGVLQWNTFLGSSSSDCGSSVVTGGSGNLYVTGLSRASWDSPINDHAGGYDVFVAKLDSTARGGIVVGLLEDARLPVKLHEGRLDARVAVRLKAPAGPEDGVDVVGEG